MKTGLMISSKQSKKSLKALTGSICQIMSCAKEAERSDETTQVALKVLRQATSVNGTQIHNCLFNSGGK